MIGWGRQLAPLVIAHRGASALAPENTLAAFRRARADGADGVELDVMACKGGEVVVFHDEDLERLAGRGGKVAELSLAELRAVRLAGGEPIPLLDEVLEELGPLLVNVEIKAPRALDARTARLVPRVAAIVRRHEAERRVLVSSFNPIALAELRVIAPRIPVGLLFYAKQRPALREAWARRALRPLALHPEHVLATLAQVARWHAEGYVVNVWTVDEPAELRRLAGIGVDGVITNDPGAARAALG